MENKNKVIKRQFMFANYSKSLTNKTDDLLLIKEHVYYEDGSIVPEIKFVKNYQRPFWITKKEYRNHEQKKEQELISKLDIHYSNQAKLPFDIQKALGEQSYGYVGLRDVNNSPYVYGTDILPQVLIAKKYKDTYPDTSSPFTLAGMDLETDVFENFGSTNMASYVYGKKANIAIVRNFFGKNIDENKIRKEIVEKSDVYIGEHLKSFDMEVNVIFVDKPHEIIIELMRIAHQDKPDFIGFWNIGFDMKKMIEEFNKVGIDPGLVFSDPKVPKEFKTFSWYEDPPYHISEEGEKKMKHMSEKWHKATTMSSFRFIDLLPIDRVIRARDPFRPSYSLEEVAKAEAGVGKLNFKEADGLSRIEWHRFMQSKYKVEYCVYNIFDSLLLLIKDRANSDVARAIRGILKYSDPNNLLKNPNRLMDNIYFDRLTKGYVLGSTGSSMKIGLDDLTPSKKGWICVLPSVLTYNIGSYLINEHPNWQTNITPHCADGDLKSAYPTGETCLNISKSTTAIEVCGIQGLTTYQVKAIGINFVGMSSCPVEIAKHTHNFPGFMDMLKLYKEKKIVK